MCIRDSAGTVEKGVKSALKKLKEYIDWPMFYRVSRMGIQVVCVLHFCSVLPHYKELFAQYSQRFARFRLALHLHNTKQTSILQRSGCSTLVRYCMLFLRRGITHKVRVLRHLRECKLCTADFDGELHLTQIFILAEEHVNHQLFAVTESGWVVIHGHYIVKLKLGVTYLFEQFTVFISENFDYLVIQISLGFHQLGILRIVPNFCVEKPKLP